MSGHTPGPWELKRVIDKDDYKYTEKGFEYIGPLSGSGQIGVSSIFCSEADANLVAAAPRMLEGLKMAQRIILKMSHLHNIELKKDVIGDIIAEAEGAKLK
jgi:hypothetical protein